MSCIVSVRGELGFGTVEAAVRAEAESVNAVDGARAEERDELDFWESARWAGRRRGWGIVVDAECQVPFATFEQARLYWQTLAEAACAGSVTLVLKAEEEQVVRCVASASRAATLQRLYRATSRFVDEGRYEMGLSASWRALAAHPFDHDVIARWPLLGLCPQARWQRAARQPTWFGLADPLGGLADEVAREMKSRAMNAAEELAPHSEVELTSGWSDALGLQAVLAVGPPLGVPPSSCLMNFACQMSAVRGYDALLATLCKGHPEHRDFATTLLSLSREDVQGSELAVALVAHSFVHAVPNLQARDADRAAQSQQKALIAFAAWRRRFM